MAPLGRDQLNFMLRTTLWCNLKLQILGALVILLSFWHYPENATLPTETTQSVNNLLMPEYLIVTPVWTSVTILITHECILLS